jgi:hypothetical protein
VELSSSHREVTANRPDIIIKNQKEKTCTHRRGNTCRQKCCAKGTGKEVKIQEFMYRSRRGAVENSFDLDPDVTSR